MASLWQKYVERWKDGCGSSLCPPQASRVCLARGYVPCDILFVGEAPSVGADVIGQPFVGEVRIVMDAIMKEAVPKSVKCTFTNIVGCIPKSTDGCSKAVRVPPEDAIRSCQTRLVEFIEVCHPKLLMAVGRIAERWLSVLLNEHESLRSIPVIYMTHPSYIRQMYPHNGYVFRRAVEVLRKAVEEHVTSLP